MKVVFRDALAKEMMLELASNGLVMKQKLPEDNLISLLIYDLEMQVR